MVTMNSDKLTCKRAFTEMVNVVCIVYCFRTIFDISVVHCNNKYIKEHNNYCFLKPAEGKIDGEAKNKIIAYRDSEVMWNVTFAG